MSRAVVTGAGCISALGVGFKAAIAAMYEGEVQRVSQMHLVSNLKNPSAVFAVVEEVPFEEYSHLTRTSRLGLTAVTEAVEQAWGARIDIEPQRIGVCMGTTVGSTFNEEEFYGRYLKGENPGIEAIERYLANDISHVVASHIGALGPVATVANACASGTDAIGTAKMWIDAGICDVVVAGGADELARFPFLGFSSLKNSSPERCRPFDRDRKGLNLGEGAGVVVIESEATAQLRSATILAVIAGYASAADAYHLTAPHPEGRGLRQAIQSALDFANVEAGEIGFVNAHGTGTSENDRIEGQVLADFVSPGTPVVSTKGYTGHTLGAAGGLEAVLSIGTLLEGISPASVGFETPDPDCVVVPATKPTPMNTRVAVSTSLAFGGANSVLVITAPEYA